MKHLTSSQLSGSAIDINYALDQTGPFSSLRAYGQRILREIGALGSKFMAQIRGVARLKPVPVQGKFFGPQTLPIRDPRNSRRVLAESRATLALPTAIASPQNVDRHNMVRAVPVAMPVVGMPATRTLQTVDALFAKSPYPSVFARPGVDNPFDDSRPFTGQAMRAALNAVSRRSYSEQINGKDNGFTGEVRFNIVNDLSTPTRLHLNFTDGGTVAEVSAQGVTVQFMRDAHGQISPHVIRDAMRVVNAVCGSKFNFAGLQPQDIPGVVMASAPNAIIGQAGFHQPALRVVSAPSRPGDLQGVADTLSESHVTEAASTNHVARGVRIALVPA